MKNVKILLITLFLITCSCKDQRKTDQYFVFDANNNVDIPVNDNVKNALNYIADTKISISSYCADVTTRDYIVNFYFNINHDVKELVIIQYFRNGCENEEDNIRQGVEKYTIPIQKIGSVEIVDLPGAFNIHVDKSNNDVQKLSISTDYNSDSIISEFKYARGDKFDSSDNNKNYNRFCDDVLIEIPKNQIFKLKEALEILVKEYKL